MKGRNIVMQLMMCIYFK